jgi:hypothetical protein
MLKVAFRFFVFSSLYIAVCALVMVYQLQILFSGFLMPPAFYGFVFFSTMCSYNFHWWLSSHSATGSERLQWAGANRSVHLWLYLLSLVGVVVSFWLIRQHWFWIAVGAVLTFLYSAPKIPQRFFIALRKIAIGKTIFLAMVWTYVTTLLPLFVAGEPWQPAFAWLACSRFFLVYAICILFDYRDREDDKADGIRSMITWFNERGINNLFAISMLLFVFFAVLIFPEILTAKRLVAWLIPGAIVAALYPYAKKHFSDYLYYFILDGLMMLSGLLMMVI